jgi:hypothetical protein
LKQALQTAQQRYLDRGPTFGVKVVEPLSERAESERKEIVGNLAGTLHRCDTLLAENKNVVAKFGRDTERLRVRLSRQNHRADDVRKTLYLHSEKIRFVLDRLSAGLLTGQDALPAASNPLSNQDHITPQNSAALRPLSSDDEHQPSEKVTRKFESKLLADAPAGIDQGVSLGQGFDVLLLILHDSNEGAEQTPEKYLHYLKARWLLSRLKAGTAFKTACPALYYKHAVRQVELAIASKAFQQVIKYDDPILLSLPEILFRIWLPSTAVPTPVVVDQSHPLVARANEVPIATIELVANPAEPSSVTIFRSSDERFRIVLKSSIAGEQSLFQHTVYCSQDNLVPRYALPTLSNPCTEIAIFSRGDETLFKFDSLKDLFEFQTALTGYDVSHDQTNIRCQFSDEAYFLDCAGRLQLWQEPIIMPTEDVGGSLGPLSARSGASFADRSGGRRDSLIPSVTQTNTVSWTVGGWEADGIKLPVMTIFTQIQDKRKNNRFAILFVPLQRGIYIDASECGCQREYEKCSKLVLVHEKKPEFAVRVLYSEIDSTGQPDPNTFDIFPFRLPRHPNFNKADVKQTKYLVLKFRSLPEKQSFHRELDLRFRVRDKQIADQRLFADSIRRRQDRPESRRQTFANSPETQSHADTSFMPSLPPIIDAPDTGPRLAEAFAMGARSPSVRSAANVCPLQVASPQLNADVLLRQPVPSRNVGTRSAPPSARSAESMCTSLDSMVISDHDNEKIDQYLAGYINPSPVAVIPNNYEYQTRQKIEEYYGVSDARAVTRLSRSPSSLAPEAYPTATIHEAPDTNEVSCSSYSHAHALPLSYEGRYIADRGSDTAEYDLIPPPLESGPGISPGPWSPESITGGHANGLRGRIPDAPSPPIPLQDVDPYVQREAQISRSRSSRPTARWKVWRK